MLTLYNRIQLISVVPNMFRYGIFVWFLNYETYLNIYSQCFNAKFCAFEVECCEILKWTLLWFIYSSSFFVFLTERVSIIDLLHHQDCIKHCTLSRLVKYVCYL